MDEVRQLPERDWWRHAVFRSKTYLPAGVPTERLYQQAVDLAAGMAGQGGERQTARHSKFNVGSLADVTDQGLADKDFWFADAHLAGIMSDDTIFQKALLVVKHFYNSKMTDELDRHYSTLACNIPFSVPEGTASLKYMPLDESLTVLYETLLYQNGGCVQDTGIRADHAVHHGQGIAQSEHADRHRAAVLRQELRVRLHRGLLCQRRPHEQLQSAGEIPLPERHPTSCQHVERGQYRSVFLRHGENDNGRRQLLDAGEEPTGCRTPQGAPRHTLQPRGAAPDGGVPVPHEAVRLARMSQAQGVLAQAVSARVLLTGR